MMEFDQTLSSRVSLAHEPIPSEASISRLCWFLWHDTNPTWWPTRTTLCCCMHGWGTKEPWTLNHWTVNFPFARPVFGLTLRYVTRVWHITGWGYRSVRDPQSCSKDLRRQHLGVRSGKTPRHYSRTVERGNTVRARTASSAPEPHPHFVLMRQEVSNFRVSGLIEEAYTPPKQVSVPHSEMNNNPLGNKSKHTHILKYHGTSAE